LTFSISLETPSVAVNGGTTSNHELNEASTLSAAQDLEKSQSPPPGVAVFVRKTLPPLLLKFFEC